MNKQAWSVLLGLMVLGLASMVYGSTAMPWESPMKQIADSITGPFGVSLASVAIAFVGIRWFRGAEHGLETMFSVVVGCAFIFGAARIVAAFSGGVGASALLPVPSLPLPIFLSDALGEVLGHAWALAWGWAVVIAAGRIVDHE